MGRIAYIVLTAVLWYAGGESGSAATLAAALALTLVTVGSWLLTLYGARSLSVDLKAPRPNVEKGSSAHLVLTVTNRSRLPIGAFEAVVTCRYRDGLGSWEPFVAQGVCAARTALRAELVVDMPHCGVVETCVESLAVHDLLGLFTFRSTPGAAEELTVIPGELAPWAPPFSLGGVSLEGELQQHSRRPGAASPDIHGLRPYRAGDPLRDVHWKLSARTGELVTKVHTADRWLGAVVLADFASLGPDRALTDLDRLYASVLRVSKGLAARGVAHVVVWQDGDGVRSHEVGHDSDIGPMARELVAARRAEGPLDCVGDARHAARLLANPSLLFSVEAPGVLSYRGARIVLDAPSAVEAEHVSPLDEGGL